MWKQKTCYLLLTRVSIDYFSIKMVQDKFVHELQDEKGIEKSRICQTNNQEILRKSRTTGL